VFTRNGFWNRRTHLVPYNRIQTVMVRRTIFQRRWDLASVVVDTAGSRSLVGQDARAVDYDADDATAFADTLATRFQAAIGTPLRGRKRGDDNGTGDGTGRGTEDHR
jgi:putative membrane protein